MPTWRATWKSMGFLPAEAEEFHKIGQQGMEAPYIQAMIKDRIALRQKANQQGISQREYRKWVNQEYASKVEKVRALYTYKTKGKHGRARELAIARGTKVSNKVWEYFKWYQENKIPEGSTWRSPEPIRRKRVISSKRKKQQSRLGKLEARRDEWNDKINTSIGKGNIPLLRRQEYQRNKVQRTIDTIRGVRN